MSDTTSTADTSASTTTAAPATTTAAASTPASAATTTATPSLVGQSPATTSAAASTTDVNAYETRFGSFSDAEGNFNDGTAEYLKGLGMDSGRVERMLRQGNINNVFKALDHSQSLVEKRDGARDYIPDPANENEFNQWRDQKGIPRDPADPKNGYDFNAGLPEGESAIIPQEALAEVGKMLHGLNVPKEQANALISQVNSQLAAQTNAQKEAFAADTMQREQQSYDEFKAKHGFEFEAKEQLLGQSAKAYDFDYDDPMDRAALTNPKVMAMMVDIGEMSRTTASMPGDNVTGNGNSNASPQAQVEQIMRDHPNGAWKRDSTLVSRMNVLLKQAAGQR